MQGPTQAYFQQTHGVQGCLALFPQQRWNAAKSAAKTSGKWGLLSWGVLCSRVQEEATESALQKILMPKMDWRGANSLRNQQAWPSSLKNQGSELPS